MRFCRGLTASWCSTAQFWPPTAYLMPPHCLLQRHRLGLPPSVTGCLWEDLKCAVDQVHEKLHLDTLSTKRSKGMVKITYKIIHYNQPIYLCEQLKLMVPTGRVTRSTEAETMVIPRVLTKYRQYVSGCHSPVQWNLTNADLKAAVNKVNKLKWLLKMSWYG